MQNNPPGDTVCVAVITDMKVHLAVAEYRTGDKSALERAQNSLQELEQTQEEDKFSKDVWVSGGYMKLADILRTDDLAKAKDIIYANPNLKAR